jgi:hypothetical protein
VPFAATCLTTLVALGTLACLCGGGGLLLLRSSLETKFAEDRARRAERAEEAGLEDETRALLDALAARLAAAAGPRGALPEMLQEAPPRDPWGTPLDYERIASDRARLRSAGPDRRLGTPDDVEREVRVPG